MNKVIKQFENGSVVEELENGIHMLFIPEPPKLQNKIRTDFKGFTHINFDKLKETTYGL